MWYAADSSANKPQDQGLSYWFGAPGVGAFLSICAPLACAWVNAALSVIPLPETCAPAACARARGPETVTVAPPLPKLTAATVAVSLFPPSSIVIDSPALKPIGLATGITVAPSAVAELTVVAPAVPTVEMTAGSALAPESTVIAWPAVKPATLATLMFVAPAAAPAGKVVAGCTMKSVQLLSVSAPSGKRPALLLVADAAKAAGPKPPLAIGEVTKQPSFPVPEVAW